MLSLLIPDSVFPAVTKKLSRLSKKAGVPFEVLEGKTTFVFDPQEMVLVPIESEDGTITVHYEPAPLRAAECSRVTVGALPSENGWIFVARLEHTEAGVLVSCAPGESCPREYRERSNYCEHCRTSRKRRDTFVVRGPEGQLRQVGRNCLGDFLVTDPTAFVARAEWALEVSKMGDSGWDDERGMWFGGGGGSVTTELFVQCVCASVRHHGFRKSESDAPTKNHAAWLTKPPPGRDRRTYETWKEEQPTDADRSEAALILAWRPEGDSDYEHNLRIALELKAVDGRRMGLLASAPSAYARAMSKKLESSKKRAYAVGYLAEIGKRVDFQATLERIAYVENDWGGKTVCTLRTEGGHLLVWFATGDSPERSDIGTIFKMRGTVKKHGEYKGTPQTVMSRCKFEKVA